LDTPLWTVCFAHVYFRTETFLKADDVEVVSVRITIIIAYPYWVVVNEESRIVIVVTI